MKADALRMLCLCICFSAAQAFAQTGPSHAVKPAFPAEREHGQRHAQNESANAGAAAENTATPQRNALQFGPVGRWWDDKAVVQSVGLSNQQQRRMDSVFNANKPAIVSAYKTFLKAQAQLEAVNKDQQPDQAKVFAAIDAVNQARSSLQKATSAMLLQIRQEMSPSQIDKLQKLP